MRRTPRGWTLAVGASAAVGAGVLCAVVALVLHATRPALPYPTASRLVEVVADEDFGLEVARPIVDALRGRPDLFDRAVVYKDNMSLTFEGERDVGHVGIIAAHDLLQTLGVRPLLGRLFLPEEDLPGRGQSIILSENLWRSRFGSDSTLLGRTIGFEGRLGPMTVVGIVADGDARLPVHGPGAGFVLPLGNAGGAAWMSDVSLMARMAPGRSRGDAVDWWEAVAAEVTADAEAGFALRPFRGVDSGSETGAILLGLAAVAALVLGVSVLNVAVLSWLATLRDARALAVRMALGASRWRVALLLVRRCVWPGGLGALAGVVAAWAVLGQLHAIASRNVVGVVPQVSWVSATAALGVCVLFAVAGALWPLRPLLGLEVTSPLRSEPGGWSGLGGGRLRPVVALQVAVVAALLMVGTLFEAAVDAYVAEDRGFEVADVSFGGVTLSGASEPGESAAEVARLLDDPQLQAAGLTVGEAPLSGRIGGFTGAVRTPGDELATTARTWVASVSSEYNATLGIDLVEGRFFSPEEAARGSAVAVLDTATARALALGPAPLGRTVEVGTGAGWAAVEVIGTVESLRLIDARTQRQVRQVYVPFTLTPARDFPLIVDARLAASAPTLIGRILPGATVRPFASFRDLYRAEVGMQLVASRALRVVATLGLVLAATGLFAVLGQATERRRREFGVRQAVGASPASIVFLSLGSGLALALAGLGAGLVAAVGAGRVLRAALLGVPAWDAGSLALTAAIVLSAALVACMHPALTAARTDPADLMRAE